MTPHIETEQAVIGAILWDATPAFNELANEHLTADCFTDNHARTLYRWAAKRVADGQPLDMIEANRENKAIPLDYLERCVDLHRSMAHLREHASVLRTEAVGRSIIQSAKSAIDAISREGADIEQERSKLEMAVSCLAARKYAARSTGDMVDVAILDWRRVKSSKGECVGVRTGFAAIDTYFGGILKSAYYVLSGSPGSCKTTLARNIIENVAEAGEPVSMLSLEQTGEQIMGAIAARYAKQSVFFLNFGHHRADPEAVASWRDYVAALPIRIEDKPHTISEVKSWYRREVAKGARLIVIDYLQRIQPDSGMERLSDEGIASRISTAIADLAKDTTIPALVISGLSRKGQLRGSGVIDYDAYCHLRMDKSEDYSPDNLRYVANFEKQRFGPPCNAQFLRLLGDEGRLIDENAWDARNTATKGAQDDDDTPTDY